MAAPLRTLAWWMVAAIGLTGCVADDLDNRRDPYGSSGGDFCYSGDSCPVAFTHPLGWPAAQTIELFGDFKPDGWDVGVPLQVDGREWRTEIATMPGAVIRYRFLINGTDWVTDPLNPVTEPDGQGGEVSVVTAQCSVARCGG